MAAWNGILKRVLSACGWVRGDAIEWCQGRNWHIRAPVWLLLATFGVRQAINPQAWTLFSGINLPIHEGGHLLFRLLGWEFLHVAGGTLLQLLAPLASVVVFFKQRDYFAIAFCMGWWSTNLMNIGVYMADASAMQLPLVTAEGGGDGIIHDWQFLFATFGLLNACEAIGWLTRQAANVVMLASLGLGG